VDGKQRVLGKGQPLLVLADEAVVVECYVRGDNVSVDGAVYGGDVFEVLAYAKVGADGSDGDAPRSGRKGRRGEVGGGERLAEAAERIEHWGETPFLHSEAGLS